MSTIAAGTTTTTGFNVSSDTTGTLVFQTGATPTTAVSISSAQVSTFSNTANFNGSSTTFAAVFPNIVETVTVSATAATGTINFYVGTQSILYYTSNSSANFTLNFAFSSGTSMNTALAAGQTITGVFLNTNGATPYYANAFQIDGVSVTPKWQGGTAPTAGNASAVDAYQFAITKTASATYTVFASLVQFK